jgi:hypothetical protein
MSEFPDFTSIIDTEQTITREIQLGVEEGDNRYDFRKKYGRDGWFRPSRIKLIYRVNRGSTAPYWYLFQVKITGGKVLSGGHRVSTAFVNIVNESFYPEDAPPWALKIGAMLLPRVEIEPTAFNSGDLPGV